MSLTIALAMLAQAAPAVAPDPDAIVITAQRSPSRVQPPTDELGGERLIERQARNAAEAIDALPGVAVRTNSRGETIARVRGSEERQTKVFLDGTPLAVPWDGRVDLGILPAGLIGSVRGDQGRGADRIWHQRGRRRGRFARASAGRRGMLRG